VLGVNNRVLPKHTLQSMEGQLLQKHIFRYQDQ